MNTIVKYTVFITLMLIAIMFSVHGRVYGGTIFLAFAVGFAVMFLIENDDDSNSDFYKLT